MHRNNCGAQAVCAGTVADRLRELPKRRPAVGVAGEDGDVE